jgi:hypothetical protein
LKPFRPGRSRIAILPGSRLRPRFEPLDFLMIERVIASL